MVDFEFGCAAPNGTMVLEVGSLGLVAGAFDSFGLEDLINQKIGKEGSHVKVNSGAISKALVMQMLNVPYQTLSGTEEYYKNIALKTLVKDKITHKDLGRGVLGRFLDAVADYGSEKLYLECASQVVKSLGITISEGHIDSTSFHYDGKTREESDCELVLKKGYSRDHRPDLNQAIEVMIADGQSRIPFYAKNVSGNINDNRSFNNALKYAVSTIKEQLRDFKYLVGDSALCTPDNFDEAAKQGMKLVTRMPDKNSFATQCFEKCSPDGMNPVFEADEQSEQVPLGQWCGETMIGEQRVKALLVFNGNLKEQKSQTINKKASKELDEMTAKIKKLSTSPCKCKQDAKKAVDELKKKCHYCEISGVEYEEVYKNAKKGRPAADKEAEKILVAVKVTANVTINEKEVARTLEKEMMYVIVTNDTERDWSMGELLSTYKRNSVIERNWRCCKNPKFFVDAIYLKSPSRIDALLWLMSLALLVYAAMEYKIRKVMKENNLEIPSIVRGRVEKQPTMLRFLQYVGNCRINVFKIGEGPVYISNLEPVLQKILIGLGSTWCEYFCSKNYETCFE